MRPCVFVSLVGVREWAQFMIVTVAIDHRRTKRASAMSF
jgi:hypothetical protein